LGVGKKMAAQDCLERLRSFRQSDSQLIKLRLRALEAMFDYYGEGNAQSAAGALGEIIPVFRELGTLPELWRVQVLYTKCLRKLGKTGNELQDLESENYKLLEKLATSLSLDDRIVFLLNKPTIDEEEIARQITALLELESRPSRGWARVIGKKY